jgi:hypothetical protein
MPALLHTAPRVSTWLTQQKPNRLEPASPQGALVFRAPSIAVRQWAPASTVTATATTTSSPVNTAIQKPSNEVVGGAVVGSLVGATLIILLLLCCCYTRRGGSGRGGSSTTSSSSASSQPHPRKPQSPPPSAPPELVPVGPPGPGPLPPPPAELDSTPVDELPQARISRVNGSLAKVRRQPLKVKRPTPPRRTQPHDAISDHESVSSADPHPPVLLFPYAGRSHAPKVCCYRHLLKR